MKRYVGYSLILLLLAGIGWAGVTLTDVENDASVGRVKEVINANNTTLEAAVLDKLDTETVTGAWTFSTPSRMGNTSANSAPTNLVLTSSYYNKNVWLTNNVSTTVTLPANGVASGVWIMVGLHSTVTSTVGVYTVNAATTDTLIGPGDADLKGVTWGNASKVNFQAKFVSDGSFWHVQNLGGGTMISND